jgi:putative sigma-54 modulation protein
VQLQVKGKNLPVTDALFEHAERRLQRLTKVFPAADEATKVELELSVERNPSIASNQVAEVTVWTKGPVLRVRESATDMYAAIDQAAHRIERQAGRYRDRRKKRDRSGIESVATVPPDVVLVGQASAEEPGLVEAVPVEDEAPIRIVRSKTFEMHDMAPEDAAIQLELLDHDFYVFRSSVTGKVSVMYKRRDGDYGLIEPGD